MKFLVDMKRITRLDEESGINFRPGLKADAFL